MIRYNSPLNKQIHGGIEFVYQTNSRIKGICLNCQNRRIGLTAYQIWALMSAHYLLSFLRAKFLREFTSVVSV